MFAELLYSHLDLLIFIRNFELLSHMKQTDGQVSSFPLGEHVIFKDAPLLSAVTF